MKMINKKKLFLAMGILVLLVVSFFYFQNENEKKEERKVLENFVKEHNASIEKVKKENFNYKVEKTNLGEDIQKISFKTDKNESEENSEELKPLIQEKEISFENREIKPYTEPLPPMPDEEVARETFVDENQNGVRDDIEIPIVKEFGSDRDLVEAFFAETRVLENELKLSKTDTLDYDSIQKFNKYLGASYDCNFELFRSSNFSQKDFDKDLHVHNKYLKKLIYKKYFNSDERKKLNQRFQHKSGGTSIPIGSLRDLQRCRDFFQKTKSWNFN